MFVSSTSTRRGVPQAPRPSRVPTSVRADPSGGWVSVVLRLAALTVQPSGARSSQAPTPPRARGCEQARASAPPVG